MVIITKICNYGTEMFQDWWNTIDNTLNVNCQNKNYVNSMQVITLKPKLKR